MRKPKRRAGLAVGTKVSFDIAGREYCSRGEAIIREAEYDNGWCYRLEILSGENVDLARQNDGPLWVLDFQVTAIGTPLAPGTKVRFDIAHGQTVGEGIIQEAHFDGGWLYRVDVLSGENIAKARHSDGDLYAWDFEVAPVTGGS